MTYSNQWLQERADLLATLTEWRERAEKAERNIARQSVALDYFLLRDFEKPYAWAYRRERAEELARAALKIVENTDE